MPLTLCDMILIFMVLILLLLDFRTRGISHKNSICVSIERCCVDTNVQSLVTQDIGVVDRDIQAPETRNLFQGLLLLCPVPQETDVFLLRDQLESCIV